MLMLVVACEMRESSRELGKIISVPMGVLLVSVLRECSADREGERLD